MHILIKEILAIAIRFSGIPFLIRGVLCRNKATIVIYHDPKPHVFAKHLKYLSKHYHFISLDKLVDAIRNRDWSNIPPKSLVITLDDGHAGNYALTALFKGYNLRPTIYLCSQIINTHRHFWFKARGIGQGGQKRYWEVLKTLSHRARLEHLKKEHGFEPQKEFPDRQALNLQELIEMAPYVDFQAHTQFHPILTTCTDSERQQEIEGCQRDLEALLNIKCDHFSYPNGDYTERDIHIVKGCGYESGRTANVGWNDLHTHPYRLKAISITDDSSIHQLIAQVSGVFHFLRYILYGSLNTAHSTITSVKRKT